MYGCGGHIAHLNIFFVLSAPGGSKWDLVTICPVAFEELFEIVIL